MKSRILSALFAVAFSGVASAGVILSPTAIVNNSFGADPFGGYPQENMINQSNVTPFVSGVTDFSAYVAGNPSAGCNNCGGQYFGLSAPGDIDFDLGGSYLVNAIGLFNGSYRGITSMDVFTSMVADFSVDTLVGSFAMATIDDPNADVPVSVLDLNDTNARYVRFHINSFSNLDSCNCLGISEVTFEVNGTAVPEPTSLGLTGAALLGLVYARRRRTEG